MSTHFENFDEGPGGWHTWVSSAVGPGAVETRQGAVICRGPWWVDYNHAPPGAGYLSILMGLRTRGDSIVRHAEDVAAFGGVNRLISQSHGTDFHGATVASRLCGELHPQDARLLYHVQANVRGRWVN